ncbi:Nif3-like dinuclear metal center hexameric protein [Helicobacter sp. 11S03491-1]|uniref:Nif3-like dinuclear metal center hexameric protein n=1 Tax=Helicobacter sp. 11S03491-1 TaxID=1476196 RepID=UPI000BA51AC5|nr:Nif3-like dinuclear metal center hexameric protein [Helicobacter sp. 11S03491-1]PAF41602.1 Nif3-like dinuclear metal center hexameric protein [Helicobacter sp. 11S03491-1]
MKVSQIYDFLNTLSPFSLQESWDNSGLNLGIIEGEVQSIYTCLELTFPIVKEIAPQSLVITHHPLFFKPLKTFIYDNYPANLAKILIEKNCSVICMHTNFDTTHLNPYFAKEVLGFENLKSGGIALNTPIDSIDFEILLKDIKQKLAIHNLLYVQATHKIDHIYIVCGGGSSYLYNGEMKSRSCLITGDIKYHDAMIAKSLGISLIDVGHYVSERFFPKIVESILKTKGYQAIIKDCENPFAYL